MDKREQIIRVATDVFNIHPDPILGNTFSICECSYEEIIKIVETFESVQISELQSSLAQEKASVKELQDKVKELETCKLTKAEAEALVDTAGQMRDDLSYYDYLSPYKFKKFKAAYNSGLNKLINIFNP